MNIWALAMRMFSAASPEEPDAHQLLSSVLKATAPSCTAMGTSSVTEALKTLTEEQSVGATDVPQYMHSHVPIPWRACLLECFWSYLELAP